MDTQGEASKGEWSHTRSREWDHTSQMKNEKKERQNKQTSIEEVTQDKDRKKLYLIKRFSCNIVVGHTPDFSLLRIE